MNIYFDVCCLNRPYDNQNQDRIHLESEAIITILKNIEHSDWQLINSGVINYEINQISDVERKARVFSLVDLATKFVPVNHKTYLRAEKIQELGIKTYDSLHIACAEEGLANVLLTTDDKLVKIAKRNIERFNVEIENPLFWLYKEFK